MQRLSYSSTLWLLIGKVCLLIGVSLEQFLGKLHRALANRLELCQSLHASCWMTCSPLSDLDLHLPLICCCLQPAPAAPAALLFGTNKSSCASSLVYCCCCFPLLFTRGRKSAPTVYGLRSKQAGTQDCPGPGLLRTQVTETE